MNEYITEIAGIAIPKSYVTECTDVTEFVTKWFGSPSFPNVSETTLKQLYALGSEGKEVKKEKVK